MVRWQRPKGRIKISPICTNSRTFTGPNLRRPKTLFRFFFSHAPDSPRGNKHLFPGTRLLLKISNPPPILLLSSLIPWCNSSVAFPPRSVLDVVAWRRRRLACSHGRLRWSRIWQCPWRRRVVLLLLRPAWHPQERLLHRHTRRLPKARHEVAPGSLGERPWRDRRGQAAVPADPGGVLRFVRQGEEGHVRRWAVRSPRRRRPGFLGLHAGDAGDDGQREKREARHSRGPAEDAG